MRTRLYAQLLAIARREIGTEGAEDVVQDALLIAIAAGHHDLADKTTGPWLCGVVRNRARMMARTTKRRRQRDHAWSTSAAPALDMELIEPSEVLAELPPALKTLAALVLTGHNRREIAYLLRLPDTALRQRISALKRHLIAKNLVAPTEMAGLNLDLAYGRIRDGLLAALRRHGGIFASHDPDGHIFLVRRSQTDRARQ